MMTADFPAWPATGGASESACCMREYSFFHDLGFAIALQPWRDGGHVAGAAARRRPAIVWPLQKGLMMRSNTAGAAQSCAGTSRSGGDLVVNEGGALRHSARAVRRPRKPVDAVPMSRSRTPETPRQRHGFGLVAHAFGACLRVEVLEGMEGFYIGTREDGLPFTRESVEYFPSRAAAERALVRGAWTQRRPVAPGALSSLDAA